MSGSDDEAAMVEEMGALMLAVASAWMEHADERGWDRDLAKLHLLVGMERFVEMSETLKMEIALRCVEAT